MSMDFWRKVCYCLLRLFLCFSRQAGEQKLAFALGAINGFRHSRHNRSGLFSSVSMKLNTSLLFSISEWKSQTMVGCSRNSK